MPSESHSVCANSNCSAEVADEGEEEQPALLSVVARARRQVGPVRDAAAQHQVPAGELPPAGQRVAGVGPPHVRAGGARREHRAVATAADQPGGDAVRAVGERTGGGLGHRPERGHVLLELAVHQEAAVAGERG
nr:hypothetical protein GCM10020092_046730 [Actinoplanes digitatis]